MSKLTRGGAVISIIIAALLFSGCRGVDTLSEVPPPGYQFRLTAFPGDQVARLGEEVVTVDDIRRKITSSWITLHFRKFDPEDVRQTALEAALDDIRLRQRFGEDDLGGDPRAIRARKLAYRLVLADKYINQIIRPKIKVSRADIESALPASRAEIKLRVLVLNPEDEAAIRRELADGADFTDMVAKYSRTGGGFGLKGDIGFVRKGKSFFDHDEEDYLWGLEIGDISRRLDFPIGPVLVKIEDKRDIDDERWEKMRENTEDGLMATRLSRFVKALLERHQTSIDLNAIRTVAEKMAAGDRSFDAVVGSINDQQIWLYDVDRRLEASYPDIVTAATPDQIANFYYGFLSSTIRQLTLAIEAEKQGIEPGPDGEKHIETFMRRTIPRIVLQDLTGHLMVSEKEVESYYRDHPEEFTGYDIVKISLIQVLDLGSALEVVEEFKSGVEFSFLAKRYSVHEPSQSKGGDVGWIRVDQLPPAVAENAGMLSKGELFPINQTGELYNIILLQEKGSQVSLSFEQVRDGLRRRLLKKEREAAVRRYIESLRSGVEVELDPDKLGSVPIKKFQEE